MSLEPNNESCVVKEDHSHSYTCKCSACLSKYGNLYLLVDAMDLEDHIQLPKRKLKKKFRSQAQRRLKFDPYLQRESQFRFILPQLYPSTKRRARSRSPLANYFCPYCQYFVNSKDEIKDHLRRHTEKQPFLCPMCKDMLSSRFGLVTHIRGHLGLCLYSCNRCKRPFHRYDDSLIHERFNLCESNMDGEG